MNVFTALADPTRRRIVETLAAGERSFGEIARGFPISGPAVSQHLRVLREAKVVHVRREAQRRIYRLDPKSLDELDAWVARLRSFWSSRLDALERELRDPDSSPREPGLDDSSPGEFHE